ncbi:uncharacterized protein B0P05DRAFT_524684 [Gilbertella persicaria]|uniref:uncharacterized protein n=1 Tax=Gilbertella persicaria TaxID=101096 RepID=UPI0022211FC7|nr:uncharacterized protein B0P05DRAFT_524684 [Gilbertella persicaria]KAI8095099.1 hypothetical protein B0P05DRAFT_524684 [Gilbertella persicaria]
MNDFVCIVTGANSLAGIGRAAVFSLAQKGVRAIYATDINKDHLDTLAQEIKATTHVECIPYLVDASSEKDIQAVISDALDRFGRLDVFFANAGVAHPQRMNTETEETFLRVMRINAWSVYAAIRNASEAMSKTSDKKPIGGGSIIATASVAGIRSGAGPVGYSASKAAVISICQSMAWRLRGKHVRVNAVCPGFTQTEMTSRLKKEADKDEDAREALNRVTPLERWGQPEDIATMVAYLASSDASFITGQDIRVDGGLSASLPYAPFFSRI